MPEGNDIARWARLTNEIEVWLYNHPVNAAREAAGQRINGVWLWGAGPGHAAAGPGAPGAGRRALRPRPGPRGGADLARPTVSGPTPRAASPTWTAHLPALRQDTTAWLAGLEALERDWFAPLLAALKAKQIRRLVISAPGDKHSLEIEVEAAGLWKFWRKPRPLAELLATAPQVQSQNP
jgi:hypothetical protein